MGPAHTNFYNDAFKRAGYTDDATTVQQLWLDGKREEAIKRVPDAMVTEFQVVVPRTWFVNVYRSTKRSHSC
jgi:hypothetical protein